MCGVAIKFGKDMSSCHCLRKHGEIRFSKAHVTDARESSTMQLPYKHSVAGTAIEALHLSNAFIFWRSLCVYWLKSWKNSGPSFSYTSCKGHHNCRSFINQSHPCPMCCAQKRALLECTALRGRLTIAAPPTLPLSSASTRAAVSTRPPRLQLIRMASCFILSILRMIHYREFSKVSCASLTQKCAWMLQCSNVLYEICNLGMPGQVVLTPACR